MSKHLALLPVLLLIGANAAPAPSAYVVDSSASDVSAKVAFFGIASKTAHFPKLRGTASVPSADPALTKLDVTIDARALTAPDKVTLRRLKSEKFFWVDRYPEVRFTGSGLALRDPRHGRIEGKLTARGITRPVILDVTFTQPLLELPQGQPFELIATTEIDRRDYGMTAYKFIVGKTVDIEISARMVPR